MNLLRWITFIPAGILLGFLLSLPIALFYGFVSVVGGWSDNLFLISVIKNGFATYFAILSMAWIAPIACNRGLFNIVSAILFGVALALSSGYLLHAILKDPSGVWEFGGEVIGLSSGFASAIFLDKRSVGNLLSNKRGKWIHNAYRED